MFRNSHMGRPARIGSKFRIQTRLPDLPRITRGVVVDRNAPSGSVHARVKCLQAIDR